MPCPNPVLFSLSLCPLTSLHRTSEASECERVEAQGGWLLSVKKTLRVQGQLQVTRAFGDWRYQPYISASPEIKILQKEEG